MTDYVFTSIRWIDGKQKKVIVDICGYIVNRNPTKEELIGVRPEISRRQLDKLSGEYRKQYLLEFLRYFNEKEGRPPTRRDFENNSGYPSYKTCANVFGSWLYALKQVGLDKESMTIKGVIENGDQKVRLPEIKVRNCTYVWFRQLEDRKVIVDICGHVVNRNPTKEELKDIKRELSRIEGNKDKDILLEFLRYFNEKEGRPPTQRDFEHNSAYPSRSTYVGRFGSWANALRLVGLDTDSMIRKGIVETSDQKARLAEIIVIEHFVENPADLSGENKLSQYDGICPNGRVYDVKSSKLHNGTYYNFATRNKYRENIEIYYFLGFNEDYTILEHAWRVPGEMVDSDNFTITMIGKRGDSVDIEDMEDYDITDMIKEVFDNVKKD